MKSIITIIILSFLIFFSSCRGEDAEFRSDSKKIIEKTVAVVLPLEKGLEDHWTRTLDWYTKNLERAYKNQEVLIRLNFEVYDENTENLESLIQSLARREDIYAVIGGLYSSNAAVITSGLSRVDKTFFTFATSEEFIRAYSNSGNLWALVETDITQCEVLLAKVANYGGKQVALIAKDGDLYGKTFLDWFSFQARELKLENKGIFSYESSPCDAMQQAVKSGADYIICAPSEIIEIGEMLEAYNDGLDEFSPNPAPKLIFSDTAYGVDVLNLYGQNAEGIEGVTFGADPESGFDVSYETFFGVSPTTGEAQLYDALLMIGYAGWFQYLHPEYTLKDALREIVSGEYINMGSWAGEDMSLVIDALASGASPFVRGASGLLRFDTKVFTNVLATTYYSYRVYNGKYIILDYNTSDGGNRTDATLAGWNWKASQMQEFNQDETISYPALENNWALLVATSTGWSNYRHQADILAIYQQLRLHGYSDDRIILIAEDDLAFNILNPDQGVIRITPGGNNIYENVEVDYHLSDLSPYDFLSILKGDKSTGLPHVIDSSSSDNVFVVWSGHGIPGALSWNDEDGGMNAEMLSEAFKEMHHNGSYRKLLMMVEACYSGGVFEKCCDIPGMLFITAANGEENSKADYFNGDLGIWMSNRFTSTLIEQITENPSVSMRDLYYRLFLNTVGSHVMVYNADHYGNLYTSDMSEFIMGQR